MKCPYCGSENLVWDYEHGNIVCSECGSVIDQIYSDFEFIDNEPVVTSLSYYIDFKKKLDTYNRLKQLEDKIKKSKLVIYNGSNVKETSLNALKLIENNEKLLILYDVIDNIPMFRSKSIKYKLALALYFYDKKNFEKYVKNLNISPKYMSKLLSKIKIKDKIRIKELIDNKIKILNLNR